MSDECQRHHSRLADLLAIKKQDSYASTIAWIRTRVSFAILRSALVCLRGSRTQEESYLKYTGDWLRTRSLSRMYIVFVLLKIALSSGKFDTELIARSPLFISYNQELEELVYFLLNIFLKIFEQRRQRINKFLITIR